jgi:hypothetical protein
LARHTSPAHPPASGAIEHADARGGLCPRCDGMASCRACVQRRSRAWRLVDGVSVQEAASRMELPPGQVRRLVALHRDALELKAFKQDSIPVARLRAFFEAELARQPGLTRPRSRAAYASASRTSIGGWPQRDEAQRGPGQAPGGHPTGR